jgi:hypothetical protein
MSNTFTSRWAQTVYARDAAADILIANDRKARRHCHRLILLAGARRGQAPFAPDRLEQVANLPAA